MRIEQIISAVVIEGTDFTEGFGRRGFELSKGLISHLGTAAIDPNKLSGQHLWRNSRSFGSRVFCSDTMHSSLSGTVHGWRYKRCREGTAESFGSAAR
jgi:hypothetical protein